MAHGRRSIDTDRRGDRPNPTHRGSPNRSDGQSGTGGARRGDRERGPRRHRERSAECCDSGSPYLRRRYAGQAQGIVQFGLEAVVSDYLGGERGDDERPRRARRRDEERHFDRARPGNVRSGSATMGMQAIGAAFPPWRQVMPAAKPEGAVEVDVSALSSAVARASILAKEATGASFELGADGLLITTRDDQGREMVAEVEATGKPFSLRLNPAYARAALDAMDTDTCKLQVSAPLDPVLMTSTSGAVSVVLMPPPRTHSCGSCARRPAAGTGRAACPRSSPDGRRRR